jgi:hypothetical protein
MATGRNSAGINKAGGKNVNPVYKAVNTLTSYAGNVARELRDIPTAVGTLAQANTSSRVTQAISNLGRQVKEVGTAAVKGESGTTSNRISSGENRPKGKYAEYGTYIKGSKRK